LICYSRWRGRQREREYSSADIDSFANEFIINILFPKTLLCTSLNFSLQINLRETKQIALKHFSITVLIGIALVVFIACTKESTPYGHVDGNKTPSPDPLTDFGSAIFRGVQGGLTQMVLTNDPPSIKQLENETFLQERLVP
jgi:hypothetical protein